VVSHLSSRSKQRLDLGGYSPVYHVGGEYLILRFLEAALVLLAVNERRKGFLLFPEEGL
jgi:hypothetical protein